MYIIIDEVGRVYKARKITAEDKDLAINTDTLDIINTKTCKRLTHEGWLVIDPWD